ncbi:MAG TPA: surface carbohydrate biosynthesis protein [Anaerolineales bacterium]|nr:surface carbohydrate biosynthesis protein [Anaerolineales bacterium]
MQNAAKKYKWLILPIETKVRELGGKVLLAATAAERGWGVILGHKDTSVADSAGIKGIALEKDGHVGNHRIAEFAEAGKKVCVMDEEGLVYHNGHEYSRKRLNPENYQRMENIFLWGSVQRRDLLEHIRVEESKLVLTGNPRFDLLRPELRQYFAAEAGRLKSKYGPFLLVNTNFGESSHYMGTEWLIKQHRKSGFIANEQDEAEEMAFIKYQARIADSFRKMIPIISSHYPAYKIIVRPHPSEDHFRWIAWAKKLKNVFVIHEGDVNPWLLAAELSIHNSCMTGIQGFLLDKPVITYMPIQSDRFDFTLPNAVSTRTTSPEQVVSAVAQIIDHPGSSDQAARVEQMQVAGQYMSAMTGPFAADRMMDALEAIDVEPDFYPLKAAPAPESKDIPPETAQAPRSLRSFLRDLRDRNREARLSKAEKIQLAYARQKFPGISRADVLTSISRLHEITGRFAGIQVNQLGDNSYCILPGE